MDRRLYHDIVSQRYAAQYRRPHVVVHKRGARPVGRPIADIIPTEKLSVSAPSKISSPKQVMDILPSQHHRTVSRVASSPVAHHTHAPKKVYRSIDEIIIDGFTYPRAQRSRSALLIYAMAGLIFCAGLSVSAYSFMTTKKAEQQVLAIENNVASDGSSSGESPPSEEKPPADTSRYVVAPNLPKIISIPSLGVSARVMQVGVDNNNTMRVPANVHDTAWYNGSNLPGQAGAVVINGHVSGPTAHGVFYDLKNIKDDQQIIIERGDGKKFTYVVRRVETVKVSDIDMNKLMVPYEAAGQGLNLITCGGLFNASTNQFDSRTMVFAVAI